MLAALSFLVVTTARAAASPNAAARGGPALQVEDEHVTAVGLDDRDELALDLEPTRTGWPDAWERGSPCDCDHAVLARVLASSPPLHAVVSAAQHAAGVATDPTSRWRLRSRLSALVPSISIRIGNSESWRDITDPTVSYANAMGATVSWRLEQLVFDPNEPRFTVLALARRRERRRVAQLASHAYFGWIAARAATEQDARWLLRLHQARADLDALTDGWFSRALVNHRTLHPEHHNPAESRGSVR